MNAPDDYDDAHQAQAGDEAGEAEPVAEAESAALKARIVIRELLDEVQGAVSRTRTAGMARVEAASHVQAALSYLATPHLAQSAIHAAWGMAYMDVAAKRSKMPEAIAARWSEVRAALPESVRRSMEERSWVSGAGGRRRQRVARPATTADQGEQRRGA